jgi:Tol biopolymer transport system component
VRSAAFSPDGSLITLATDEGKGTNPAIYTIHLDGSGLQRITHTSLWNSATDWGSH